MIFRAARQSAVRWTVFRASSVRCAGAGAMVEPFDSAWLKWGRAVVHSRALEKEIAGFVSGLDQDYLKFGIAPYDPKRHGFAIGITEIKPFPASWGVLLG